MGNLDLNASSDRSPYSRRPIFNRDNSVQYQAAPHSLSPYLARTPKPSMYRNGFNHPNYLRYSKINQSKHKNRVYISPKMISSVIKDSPNCQPVVINQNNMRGLLQHNPYTNNARIPKTAKNNLFHEKYSEKPFQSSPNKGKIIMHNYHDKKTNLINETKQNFEEDTFQQQSFNRNQIPQQFTISTITNKSPLSLSKIAKSGQTSGRNYQIESYHALSPHKCCCHNQMNMPERINLEQFSIDNAPTERKKPVRTFEPLGTRQQKQVTKGKKLKIDVNENSDSQTIRAIKQNKIQSSTIYRQNRQKCQQIIKRVRNFNEFLNEIKKKLKKEADIASSQNYTISSMSINEQESVNQPSFNTSLDQHNNSIGTDYNQKISSHKKSITMALKLENQKIQLEKYRKMVERELSKQHSIQSIQIQGGRNKQKIITISFQNKTIKHMQLKNGQKSSRVVEKSKNSQKHEQESTWVHKINEDKSVNKRVNKISKLMNKLEGMQSKLENQNYRQIREVLRNQRQEITEDDL